MTTQTRTLQEELTIFRENWSSVRCTVYDDRIVYKVTRGWSGKAATRANDLINTLGLNLEAIGTGFPAKDSFVVL